MHNSVRLQHRGSAISAAVIAAVMFVIMLAAAPANPAFAAEGAGLAGADSASLKSPALSAQAQEDGWVWSDSKGCWYYYRDGKKLTGLHKIDGRRYIFKESGRLYDRDFERNGVTYYLRHGQLSIMGFKMNGKYYYDTMKPMTSADSYDFDTLIWARSINNSISGKNDSDGTKLWNAFKWVVNQSYAIHQNFNPYEENWVAKYARYHFSGSGGDCHSDGAAFAYLAAEIGYDADTCIDSWGTGYAPSHCWTMIGNAVYDPLFYESKSTMYYGATSGTYETNPTARFSVPTYSSSHASASSKVNKNLVKSSYAGLTKVDDNYYFYKSGSPLKSTWKKVNGKTYYFKKDGTAATGSVMVRGKHYVFNTKGQLLTSKKSGNRVVKVAGNYYRVNKKGRAVSGFSPNKKKYFFKSGRMLVGTQVVKGKFFVASNKGVYDKSKTNLLRKASKANAPAGKLYNLLGKPNAMYYTDISEVKSKDGLCEFDDFIVTTIRPHDAHTVKYDAKRLAKGKKLTKPYEYVVAVEAR